MIMIFTAYWYLNKQYIIYSFITTTQTKSQNIKKDYMQQKVHPRSLSIRHLWLTFMCRLICNDVAF